MGTYESTNDDNFPKLVGFAEPGFAPWISHVFACSVSQASWSQTFGFYPDTIAMASPSKAEGAPKAKAVPVATKASAIAGVNTLSPASAGGAGGAAGGVPKASTPSAPPSSAAATVEEGRKPMTAAERLSGTGSALSKGVGAKAEPATKAKAKAKMAPMPNRPLPREVMGTAPPQVVNMVSGKPQPATQGGTSGYATSSVGPARAYAKTAAGVVGGEVPKAGPPAVAMGRAMAEGRPAVTMVNGKPVTTITKKYQLVFVTG